MNKKDALRLIKNLRDLINDTTDEDNSDLWVNNVCSHLDAAADIIEFPKKERAA